MGSHFLLSQCNVGIALVLHGLGMDPEAASLLTDAFRFERKMKGVKTLSVAILSMALSSFDNGREARGRACLRKAFNLGREGGFFFPGGSTRTIWPGFVPRPSNTASRWNMRGNISAGFI